MNKRLTCVLKNSGFVANPHDPCVFNKMHEGEQITVGIHVDDLLVTCKMEDGIAEVMRILKSEFQEVKVNKGREHSYLGMRIVHHDGGIDMDMETYLQNVMKTCEVSGAANPPHGTDLRK